MSDQDIGGSTDDGRLRTEFGALRDVQGEAGRVPDFDEMLSRAKDVAAARPALEVLDGGGTGDRAGGSDRRRRLSRIGGWVSLATAAVAAGLLLIGDPAPDMDADAEFERLVSAYAMDAAAGAWRSPTASFMRVPGLDLGSVPAVGRALREFDAEPSETDGSDGRDL